MTSSTLTASLPPTTASTNSKKILQELVGHADIEFNGSHPLDIQINDERFYRRVLRDGTLGFGEAYMDGWWDAEQIDETVHRLLRSDLQDQLKNPKALLSYIGAVLINKARPSKAFEIGEKHYDLGNNLFEVMLDARMVYTCGYWKNARTLDEAQEAKLDLVCRKVGLKPGDRVLDIGCGWGSFLKFAAENYGVTGVGITVSTEQVGLAEENLAGLPLEIRLQDYRALNGEEKFDHVVSLGMFEHVGYKNYPLYMDVVDRNLKDDGFFLLHTIGIRHSSKSTDPWIDKYIFPNSMLPSILQIGKASEKRFVMEDLHNFSSDYDRTLMAWYENFKNGWDALKSDYNERFYRMWKYFLLSCAGSFRARNTQLWQIVFSKKGVPGGYESIR
ncbi:MAG: cyclopropane fatty acyl phospholipid synthase [Rhodothermia bacterium]|nr:MAG: cyclopropane fatty acyl phospholipid synthase [Rhodothermia bacterium]